MNSFCGVTNQIALCPLSNAPLIGCDNCKTSLKLRILAFAPFRSGCSYVCTLSNRTRPRTGESLSNKECFDRSGAGINAKLPNPVVHRCRNCLLENESLLLIQLVVHKDVSTDGCLIIDPGGVIRVHINASMAHWCAKIAMPVCSMNAVPFMEE